MTSTSQSALQPLLRLPSHLHKTLTKTGKLLPSEHQTAALPHLDSLTLSLPPHATALRAHQNELSHLSRLRDAAITTRKRKPLHSLRLLLHGHSPNAHPSTLPNSFYSLPSAPPPPTPPRGVYLHGDVGSGKTLLMDLLFSCAPLPAERVHFHPFMTAVYESIHRYDTTPPDQRALRGWAHPLDAVVNRLPVGLLCFDEFQVADVADARLMHGVFQRLMHAGTVVCFTANRAPGEVNRSQLRDDDFRPFLDLLYDRCALVQVEGLDYRGVLAEIDDSVECYFGKGDVRGVQTVWEQLTAAAWDDVVSAEWDVAYGRKIFLKRVSPGRRAVQMSTAELLEAPVGAADYRAVARNVDMIVLTDVLPRFDSDTRNLARRFITLVDVCYEEKVRLVMRMETALDALFTEVDAVGVDVSIAEGLQFEGEVALEGVGAGNRGVGVGNLYTGEDERFAFRRAVSRLREMRTSGFGRRVLCD